MTNRLRGAFGAFVLAFGVTAGMGQNAALAELKPSLYVGRWTVDDPKDKFSANGKLYRVLDIARCGARLCGITVDGGACGRVLFRVAGAGDDESAVKGSAQWGERRTGMSMSAQADKTLALSLGDDDVVVDSRGSMPTFYAEYHRIGEPQCSADAPPV